MIKLKWKWMLLAGYFVIKNVYADCNSVDSRSILACIDQEVTQNTQFINEISYLLESHDINIYSSQWHEYVSKKCNWVKKNIDTLSYGHEDQFSAGICLITEQNARINELRYLINEKNIVNLRLNKLREALNRFFIDKGISGSHTVNVYFNYLSSRFAQKFCPAFYADQALAQCVNRIVSHQFSPEEYGFYIHLNKAYLLNKPQFDAKTSMYLIKDDKVELVQRQGDFYQIDYQSAKKGKIRQWIHCSVIDAC